MFLIICHVHLIMIIVMLHVFGRHFGSHIGLCTNNVTTDEPIIIKPAEMKTPFTTEGIEKASTSMKYGKSFGEDGLKLCRICKIWTPRNTQWNCSTAKYYSKNRQIPCRNKIGNTRTSSKTWTETGTASKTSTKYSALNND